MDMDSLVRIAVILAIPLGIACVPTFMMALMVGLVLLAIVPVLLDWIMEFLGGLWEFLGEFVSRFPC